MKRYKLITGNTLRLSRDNIAITLRSDKRGFFELKDAFCEHWSAELAAAVKRGEIIALPARRSIGTPHAGELHAK